MKKKNIKNFTITTILFLIIILLAFFISSFFYLNELKESKKDIQKCYFHDTNTYSVNEAFHPGNDGCYEKMLKLLYPRLLVHKVKHKNKPSEIINPDSLFFIDKSALEKSDAILSYGIGNMDENTFEIKIIKITQKPIYAFDCGLTDEEMKTFNKLADNMRFIDECIGTDKYLMYGQTSSGKIHTFGQKLKELNLTDKKIYLKLGIPEPHLYIDDILKYKDNITGISVVVDFWSPKYIIDSINLLNKLEKDFVLVSCYYFYIYDNDFFDTLFKKNHTNCYNYSFNYKILNHFNLLHHPVSILLINKNLIEKDSIYWNQNNNPAKKIRNNFKTPIKGFSGFQIVLFEKLKNYKKELKNKLKH